MTEPQKDKLKKIISNIKNVRTKNNYNWMQILEIAILNAPEQALEAMQGIHNCDGDIQDSFSELVAELQRVVK